jgi:murein DD-endopeptidase MepM/ murein hydrolase activator NlpD
MIANEYLNRHGGRLGAVLFTGVLSASIALGGAKADVAQTTTTTALSQAIFSTMRQVAVQPTPVIAFSEPLPGFAVNSPFGMRALETENHARVHEGVDIAAPIGSPIHATANGHVIRAGLSQSYGNFVEVDHGDGITSFYAHMKRPADVRGGDAITSGEVLGYVGSTGHSTGPHLHFEIRKDGQHFDPGLFMGHAFMKLADLPFVRSAENGFGNWKARVVKASWHGSSRSSGGRVHHAYGHGGGFGRSSRAR